MSKNENLLKSLDANERQSNFEVLRIFAMLFIVLTHLCQHGLWFPEGTVLSKNVYISNCFYTWTGQLGNWLFILTSGYFVSMSKFSWKKVFKIWFQIFLISSLIGIILYATKIPLIVFSNPDYNSLGYFQAAKPATIKDLIRSLLPTFHGNNWFASAYLLFYLFTPFLNESLKVLDEQKHRNLIILMTLIGTVVYMIYGQGFFHEGNLFYFILGFYIASYIRLYDPKFLRNQKVNIIGTILLASCFVLWIALVLYFRNKISFIDNHYEQVFMYPFALNRFPILLCSVFLFSFFKNLKIKNNKLINTIASTTFGVYLIHENRLLNKIIWHRIFKFDNFMYSKYLFLYMLLATVVTFCCCSIIDYLRQILIEKPIMKILYKRDKIKA